MHNQTITPPRAQVGFTIPWPATPAGEAETCCVALRVQVTQDRVDTDVDIVHDLPLIAAGEPEQTLYELTEQTLSELIEYRLEGSVREVLLAELDAIGSIDPQCPLVLEGLHVDGGRAVHVEALVLPVAREQVAELDELLRSESDPSTRHGLGWLYAEDLAGIWREASPDGQLPIRYLEDALRERHAARRPHELPASAAQPAMLASA